MRLSSDDALRVSPQNRCKAQTFRMIHTAAQNQPLACMPTTG